jgi:DNA-binding NarL/FixJ family response regulator
MRSAIRSLLEREPDIQVVGEASHGEEALELSQQLQPDVLLLDMEMPGLGGIEVARQLNERGSPVRILGLSAYDDRHYILNMLANGASGYLTKEEAPQAIVEAVRGVWRGEKGWLSRSAASRVMTWMHDDESETPELTDRELDVLELVASGKTNQAIGAALGISEKTVEKHLEGVFAKLNVSSRVEAAVRAVREGLIE